MILLTLDWLWGHPQTLLQQKHVWSVLGGKRRKADPFIKLGEPACNPQTVLDRHFWCLFCFCFSFLNPVFVHLRHGLTVPTTKACLLCATPADTYRVQSHGFPTIVYLSKATEMRSEITYLFWLICCFPVQCLVEFWQDSKVYRYDAMNIIWRKTLMLFECLFVAWHRGLHRQFADCVFVA